MATLNPQSLVTLWQIEQYGSFSATAKATGWSQPAISQQIKKLEAQCGSTLVQRTSHGTGTRRCRRIPWDPRSACHARTWL